MTLLSPDPAVRANAADAVFASADPEALPTLDTALARESEGWVAAKLERARAAVILKTDADVASKLAAVETIAAGGNRQALSLLVALRASADGELREAAATGVEAIERRLRTWEMAQHVTYGLSLGSVLLLAAIGLAITFGVMGVINMAHGEMVMLGAYTTFVVQQAIRPTTPSSSTPRSSSPSRWPSPSPGPSASPSSAASSAGSTAARSRPCSPPGASRWCCSRPCAPSSARPTARSATRPGCPARWSWVP
jgi:hypothetical protein